MYKLFIMVKTLNRGEIMKKIVMYSVYSVCLILMICVLVGYNSLNKETSSPEVLVDYDYVYDLFKNPIQQVNSESDLTVIKPYTNEKVSIAQNYYDYRGEEKEQQNSIIYYDGTYMQSTGVSYSSGEAFDVVSVLPGEVTEVVEDELIGNSITIKHEDNTYSVYQSVTDITVSKGDSVNQGDKIAVSSTSNLNKDLNNHLYFELIIDGKSVNPEEYYDAAL